MRWLLPLLCLNHCLRVSIKGGQNWMIWQRKNSNLWRIMPLKNRNNMLLIHSENLLHLRHLNLCSCVIETTFPGDRLAAKCTLFFLYFNKYGFLYKVQGTCSTAAIECHCNHTLISAFCDTFWTGKRKWRYRWLLPDQNLLADRSSSKKLRSNAHPHSKRSARDLHLKFSVGGQKLFLVGSGPRE